MKTKRQKWYDPEEKNSYEDPFVGMNSREIEEEMRRMDEEDLNLNFGDF